MYSFQNLKIQALLSFAWIVFFQFLCGCGQNSIPNPVNPSSTIGNHRAHYDLLKKRDLNQDKINRQHFLKTVWAQEFIHTNGLITYLVNQSLINHRNLAVVNHYYPISPLVHSYNMWHIMPIKFAARFPISFAVNLPEALQMIVNEQKDLEDLEIFFTPQFGAYLLTDNGPALKGHFWAVPETPINFGEYYNRNLPMAIFDPDYPIHRHVSDKLTPVNVNVHNDTYSPPTQGGLNFPGRTAAGLFPSVSFWSLVIDEEHHRAAATLHWLIESLPIEAGFEAPLRNRVYRESFLDLIEQWDQIPDLQKGPLMQKLRTLIQI